MENMLKSPEETTDIERIKLLLDFIGLPNKLESKTADNNEQVFVGFYRENKEDVRYILSISFINDIYQNEDKLDEIVPEVYFLQFITLIDVNVTSENSNDLLNLIIRLNNLLPVGSFGLNDENKIYFKYIYPTRDRKIDNVLFVEILEMLEFYLKSFAINIIDLAIKRKNFHEALDDCVSRFKNITKN